MCDLDAIIVETLKVLRREVVLDLLLAYFRALETRDWVYLLDSLICQSPPRIRDELLKDWDVVMKQGSGDSTT